MLHMELRDSGSGSSMKKPVQLSLLLMVVLRSLELRRCSCRSVSWEPSVPSCRTLKLIMRRNWSESSWLQPDELSQTDSSESAATWKDLLTLCTLLCACCTVRFHRNISTIPNDWKNKPNNANGTVNASEYSLMLYGKHNHLSPSSRQSQAACRGSRLPPSAAATTAACRHPTAMVRARWPLGYRNQRKWTNVQRVSGTFPP